MTENDAIAKFKRTSVLWESATNTEMVEAVKVAIQALKKQIPKNVYHFTDDDTFETSCCGTDVTNKDYKYCPECGQLLGEVEEIELEKQMKGGAV